MPTTWQGLISFPGVPPTLIVSGQFCLSHGISPSAGTIRCALGEQLTTTVGPVLLTFGPAGGEPTVALEFDDALIINSTTSLGGQGIVTTLSIFDRRWMWAFGSISGNYNVRYGNAVQQPGQIAGTLDPNLTRTPQQLAALCLEALGEMEFDVSQLPNDSYPEVNWDGTNPAQALGNLVEALGCRVVLQLDGSVLIAQTGLGSDLPSGGEEVISVGVKVNQPPDYLAVLGGKTRYQPDLTLVPVGLDVDGRVKPIDQLSYTPQIGWGRDDLKHSNVSAVTDNLDQNPQKLAQETVWRWYQIAAPDVDGSPLTIPGYSGPIRSIRQLLPIETEMVIQLVTPSGVAQNFPAKVYGTFCLNNGNAIPNGGWPLIYNGGFTIDTQNGIVKFADPVFLLALDNDGVTHLNVPADIYLRTAVSVRDATTWAWSRYALVSPQLAANGTGPAVLAHNEIVLNVIPTYDTTQSPPALLQINDSSDACAVEANYYLEAALSDYQVAETKDVTYVGIIPISPDGLIQQVTWTIGESGARTRASLNTEHHSAVPPFRERRFFEQLRGQVGDALVQLAEKARNTQDPWGKIH